MMNKEKLVNLLKYSEDLKNKLSSPVPAKHINHPESYKLFLKNEIRLADKKITSLKEK